MCYKGPSWLTIYYHYFIVPRVLISSRAPRLIESLGSLEFIELYNIRSRDVVTRDY
jgi:hypothetical protein